MNLMNIKSFAATGLIALGLLATGCQHQEKMQADSDEWMKHFDVPSDRFTSVGQSEYFILEPGHQMIYEGEEDDKPARLVITVLPETKMLDGVETRIVEERESAGGKLVEVSRNYFAIDKNTHDVYYFGEDVDMYKNGEMTGHGGSWHSGEKGAHYGLFMPAHAEVGQKFYQELAPGEAMDRVEIVSTTMHKKVPAGHFMNVVKTEETSPLEKGNKEYKLYAPGVGLITDGELELVKYGSGQ